MGSKNSFKKIGITFQALLLAGFLLFVHPANAQELESGLYHSHRNSLKNSYLTFQNKKTGRVVFLGGSITFNGGWRDSVCTYLQQRFPETQFEFINAGIPSMGSPSGAFRFDRDVLKNGSVDLLFEEAAVNDQAIGHQTRDIELAMEGIVRHARLANPACDIVMMHFVDPGKMQDYRNGLSPEVITIHERIASHYQVSTINLALEVTERIDAGEFDWEHDFRNLHPSPFGQGVYFRSMRQFLQDAWKQDFKGESITNYKVPPALNPACFDHGELVAPDESYVRKGWELIKNWNPNDGKGTRANYVNVPMLVGTYPGEAVEFSFTGNAVGIAVAAGPNAGIIRYQIDDSPWENRDLFTQHSKGLHLPVYYTLASGLESGVHMLQIQLSQEYNSTSTGNECVIRYFYFNGEHNISISKDDLLDKIKGGWAGQVIGCTYGGPTEFRYQGMMIPEDTVIPWDSTRVKWYYENSPGLYDDVYMDLTFVEVFDKEGLDAPAISHARAFANAGYMLWHANQAARYNILNGIDPPLSGYWENNPHADDIDFQIEADFAGLMSPGMVNTATTICDSIGHIMNYGDGWYGGVYVAAMYSLAFISDDVDYVVTEALKTIPEESGFYRCINDVIGWYRESPDDWTQTWKRCQATWSFDIGCPDGVFRPFDIDAKINAAYIVIGLLYGKGDFGKSVEIITRCGQDSDCNPASAAGILGTMLGYSRIPDYWKQGLSRVEDLDFKYTSISLNDVYDMGYGQAVENILRNGGQEKPTHLTIPLQEPLAVKLEKGFENHYPSEILSIDQDNQQLDADHPEFIFDFDGVGFVLKGGSKGDNQNPEIEVFIDGVFSERAVLPTDFTKRRHDVCWKYNLISKKHSIKIKLINSEGGNSVFLDKVLIYRSVL